ncbi:MAG: hypothetical protein ACM3ZA_07055 [Bacillota bacterium]
MKFDDVVDEHAARLYRLALRTMGSELEEQIPVPAGLEAGLKQQAARRRGGRRWSVGHWVALAAALVLALGIGAYRYSSTALAERTTYLGPNTPDPAAVKPLRSDDQAKLEALLPTMIPLHYQGPDFEGFEVVKVQTAAEAGVYGEMVENMAGAQVAKSTFVVQLHFPKLEPSASMSQGQLFITRTKQGWDVWFRYH